MVLNFDPDLIKEPQLKTVRCPRCNGTGKVLKYKHIDNGKCFMCNGSRSITLTIEPPPSLVSVPLFVTLQQVKDQWPQHDSFGDLIPAFRSSFEKLLSAIGCRDDMSLTVSIGDVALAFNAGTARHLALNIPGIDMRTITKMVLPSAERAAAAIKEPGLCRVITAARKLIDTNEEVEPLFRPSIRHFAGFWDAPESHARSCGEALAMVAGRGVVSRPDRYVFECLKVVGSASLVLQRIVSQTFNSPEVARLESERQLQDIYAVSPLHIFAAERTTTTPEL